MASNMLRIFIAAAGFLSARARVALAAFIVASAVNLVEAAAQPVETASLRAPVGADAPQSPATGGVLTGAPLD